MIIPGGTPNLPVVELTAVKVGMTSGGGRRKRSDAGWRHGNHKLSRHGRIDRDRILRCGRWRRLDDFQVTRRNIHIGRIHPGHAPWNPGIFDLDPIATRRTPQGVGLLPDQ